MSCFQSQPASSERGLAFDAFGLHDPAVSFTATCRGPLSLFFRVKVNIDRPNGTFRREREGSRLRV